MLKFDNTNIKTPTAFTLANEKIWSNNAGRTASTLFVGDIRSIKKTIHIEWARATPAEVATINSFISNASRPFFNITFLDEEFNTVTKSVYAATPSYEQWGWDEKRQLCKVLSVDLVER
jgi:hypothetical protein